MPRTGLERQDRRVRHQLHVGGGDLRRVRVEGDRAVHLPPEIEQRRRVVDVELNAAREQEAQLAPGADDDEATGARMEAIVEALAQRRSGCATLQRFTEPGL